MVSGCEVLGEGKINCELSVLQRPSSSVEYKVDFVCFSWKCTQGEKDK